LFGAKEEICVGKRSQENTIHPLENTGSQKRVKIPERQQGQLRFLKMIKGT
jgi:hypothetical protein